MPFDTPDQSPENPDATDTPLTWPGQEGAAEPVTGVPGSAPSTPPKGTSMQHTIDAVHDETERLAERLGNAMDTMNDRDWSILTLAALEVAELDDQFTAGRLNQIIFYNEAWAQ